MHFPHWWLNRSGQQIKTGIQRSMTKSSSVLIEPVLNAPTKFEVNAMSKFTTMVLKLLYHPKAQETGIQQTEKKCQSYQGSPIMSATTKFEVNLIDSLPGNGQQLFSKSEARK